MMRDISSGRIAMSMTVARQLAFLALGALVSLGPLSASAQVSNKPASATASWVPQAPIRFVVPFSPGGGTDIVARVVQQALGSSLGQPVIVDNKPGASGTIGTEHVFMAPPDGLTLAFTSVDSISMYPHLNPKVRYQAKEFTAIAPVVKISFVLMAKPGFPAKNVADLQRMARQSPLMYATWGIGTSSHLAMEMFRQGASIDRMENIPYKGAGPAVQALMAGEVDLMMVPTPLAVANRSRLTVVGLAAAERSDALKDVPTLGELGTPIDTSAWIGLIGPPKMPDHIANAIHKRVAEVTALPEVQKKLLDQAMTPHRASRDTFDKFLKTEYQRWGETVRIGNIKLEE